MSNILRQTTIIKLTILEDAGVSDLFDMSLYSGGLIYGDWEGPGFLGFSVSPSETGQAGLLWRTDSTPAEEQVVIANPGTQWQPLPDELYGAKWVKIHLLDEALTPTTVVGADALFTVILKS